MKIWAIMSLAFLVLLCPFYAAGSDFEDEPTPLEQEDIKTIVQIDGDNSFENDSTPIEQEDVKTIDQINDENSLEDDSTPIEQEDIKTIDQINK